MFLAEGKNERTEQEKNLPQEMLFLVTLSENNFDRFPRIFIEKLMEL